MTSLISLLKRSVYWSFSKWSLMLTILFWVVVYRLSQQAVHLPEFVYVNF
jgi:hypothetical protein